MGLGVAHTHPPDPSVFLIYRVSEKVYYPALPSHQDQRMSAKNSITHRRLSENLCVLKFIFQRICGIVIDVWLFVIRLPPFLSFPFRSFPFLFFSFLSFLFISFPLGWQILCIGSISESTTLICSHTQSKIPLNPLADAKTFGLYFISYNFFGGFKRPPEFPFFATLFVVSKILLNKCEQR